MNDFEQENHGSEKRIILFIIATLAAYWIWATWFMPKPAQEPRSAQTQEQAQVPVKANEPSITAPAELEVPSEPGDPNQPETTDRLPEQVIPLESAHWKGEFTNRAGVIRDTRLLAFQGATKVTPVYMWIYSLGKSLVGAGSSPGSWEPYGEEAAPESIVGPKGQLGIAGGMEENLDGGTYELVSSGARHAEFRRLTTSGLEIVKKYEILDDPYQTRLSVSWKNMGSRSLSGDLWVGLTEEENIEGGRYSNERRPQAYVDGSLVTSDNIEKLVTKPVHEIGPVSWFGEGNRYFLTALIPVDPMWGQLQVSAQGPKVRVLQVASGVTLEPGAARSTSYTIYAGPKQIPVLKAIGSDLDRSVQFGWFGFFSRILLWLLQQFHGLASNWGVAIILLTVFVKGVFYPLTQKSYRSSKEMQRIQPKINELKEKYKDKPDIANQETMKLLKEHNVNPLGGCLPTLVQLPVWMALYNVLLFSVDIYHSSFLYYRDLSAPDPYAILPVLVGVLMFVQQKITPMTGMDPTQAKMMQFMPLVFCFFTFSFPSGLGLYILVNSVLSIVQQKFIDWSYKKSVAKAS